MSTTIRCLGGLFVLALLAVCVCPNASGQGWTSTATKAYPVQNLSNAALVGPLDPSTPLHIVVGLQEQNAGQVQPTLRRMLTTGDPLYGTSLTVQQFIAQFGPTSGSGAGGAKTTSRATDLPTSRWLIISFSSRRMEPRRA